MVSDIHSAVGSNLDMETLRDYTKELQRKIDIDYASSLIQRNFDSSKPHRYVSGVAVSSKEKNANGDAFVARGVSVTLPVPLLLEHQWMKPIGKVFAIEARGDQVLFKAEIANSGRLLWLDDAWMQVVCKFMTGASIGPRNLANYPPNDSTLYNWTVDEISITEECADPGARIQRVWEMAPVVNLHRPSVTEYWKLP